MAPWYMARRMGWSTKAVIAVGLLAVLLVAAVPVALLAGVILMLLGHVIGGLAVFGVSILVAAAAVMIAGVSGVQHLRRLVTQRSYQILRARRGEYYYD